MYLYIRCTQGSGEDVTACIKISYLIGRLATLKAFTSVQNLRSVTLELPVIWRPSYSEELFYLAPYPKGNYETNDDSWVEVFAGGTFTLSDGEWTTEEVCIHDLEVFLKEVER